MDTPVLTARNLRSAFEHADFVDAHLEQSIAAFGPHGWLLLLSPPFPSMCCSGVGVVPKKSGKLRLIHHLSAPAGVSVPERWDPQRPVQSTVCHHRRRYQHDAFAPGEGHTAGKD